MPYVKFHEQILVWKPHLSPWKFKSSPPEISGITTGKKQSSSNHHAFFRGYLYINFPWGWWFTLNLLPTFVDGPPLRIGG